MKNRKIVLIILSSLQHNKNTFNQTKPSYNTYSYSHLQGFFFFWLLFHFERTHILFYSVVCTTKTPLFYSTRRRRRSSRSKSKKELSFKFTASESKKDKNRWKVIIIICQHRKIKPPTPREYSISENIARERENEKSELNVLLQQMRKMLNCLKAVFGVSSWWNERHGMRRDFFVLNEIFCIRWNWRVRDNIVPKHTVGVCVCCLCVVT